VAVPDTPAAIGDECFAQGGPAAGNDDCETSSLCWDVDPETNTGVCVSMCQGSAAAPVCEDPDELCVIVNDGVLTVCLPSCDVLVQDCGEGHACYPTPTGFACAPDYSGEGGGYGTECGAINACDAGLFCAAAEAVPDCLAPACCSEICDVTAPDADATCSGFDGGQQCEAYWTEGSAPPGEENYGVCVIPL
jgi:hypothetical protein